MSFKIGDMVYVISEFKDRYTGFSPNMKKYTNNGKAYEIVNTHEKYDGTIYQLDNGYWWYVECLSIDKEWEKERKHPNWKIINKVRQMDKRRKDLGYAI